MNDKNQNKVNKIALTVSRISELIHWVGVISMAVVFICSLTAKGWLEHLLNNNIKSFGTTLSSYGFEISIVNANGTVNMIAVTLFSFSAIIILSLFAMIFRNSYLILKTAGGKTWFSKGATPFQNDIVRMLREIGIFLVSVPLVGFTMSTISRAAIGIEATQTSVNFVSIMIGLLIFCLAQFFAYGVELQKDVDGLL